MRISDWSSDVCSSYLGELADGERRHHHQEVVGGDIAALRRRQQPLRAAQEERAFGVARMLQQECAQRLLGDVGQAQQSRHSLFGQRRQRLGLLGGNILRGGGRGRRSEEHTSELQSLMPSSYAV